MKTLIFPMTAKLLILTIIYCSFAVAEDPQMLDEKPVIAPEVATQIDSLLGDIVSLQKQISEINNAPQPGSSEVREELLETLQKRQAALEQIAVGAVDLSLFDEQPSKEFDWQEELKDVFEPAIQELKQITERPRKIERLRGQRDEIETRLEAARLAVDEIKELQRGLPQASDAGPLLALKSEWETRRDNLDGELAIINYQLNEQLKQSDTFQGRIGQALKDFFTGRGFNLAIAIISFIIVFLGFRLISHQLEKMISRGQDKESRFFARLTHVIFQVATILFAIIAATLSLYIAGDWLVLTVVLIIVVGFIFALRHSLPRYIDEVRLLLNIGPVREGERVIYRGIAWNVSRINLQSTLVNPSLSGGRLRLPMSEMIELISRRFSKDEPWFPSKPEDVVLLDDGTFGTVVLQTPEVVNLEMLGGALKSIPTLNYLSLQPRNLSGGFGLFITFGLDYGHQAEITTSVPEILEKGLLRQLNKAGFEDSLEKLQVEFEAAGASSLDMKLIVFFKGEVAKDYFTLSRLIQAAAVNICNDQHWTIPFNQITVHTAEEE